VLDTAIARPIPTARHVCSRWVRASSIQRWCKRAPSRVKGFIQGGRSSAVSDQPAAGRRHPGKAPAAIGVVSPAPHVRCPNEDARWPVYQTSEHTGGLLGAPHPQAVGAGARGPTASGSSSGGERIGMVARRMGNLERCAVPPRRRAQPPPPCIVRVRCACALLLAGFLLFCVLLIFLLAAALRLGPARGTLRCTLVWHVAETESETHSGRGSNF
jgi:hypothetical protein